MIEQLGKASFKHTANHEQSTLKKSFSEGKQEHTALQSLLKDTQNTLEEQESNRDNLFQL